MLGDILSQMSLNVQRPRPVAPATWQSLKGGDYPALPANPTNRRRSQKNACGDGRKVSTLLHNSRTMPPGAIEAWVMQQTAKALHDDLAAFARQHGGGAYDLDEDLEDAAMEHLTASGADK